MASAFLLIEPPPPWSDVVDAVVDEVVIVVVSADDADVVVLSCCCCCVNFASNALQTTNSVINVYNLCEEKDIGNHKIKNSIITVNCKSESLYVVQTLQ